MVLYQLGVFLHSLLYRTPDYAVVLLEGGCTLKWWILLRQKN